VIHGFLSHPGKLAAMAASVRKYRVWLTGGPAAGVMTPASGAVSRRAVRAFPSEREQFVARLP
jgi:hypothetical protein